MFDKKIMKFYHYLIGAFFLLSCGEKAVYEQYSKTGLSDLLWDRVESQSFEVVPPDTINAYTLVLALRHTSRIPYKSLPIAMVVANEKKAPVYLQQYEFMIRDSKTGMFIGEVMGDLGDTEQVIESEFRFKTAGTHTFTFIHGLADEDKAKEVMGLGLILKAIKK